MQTAQLIIEILLFLIGLYLAFFKSYFGEKGKNLATKEDISEITEKIENIKNSYAHSLEKAKSELQIKSALQQTFQGKCLEAVVAVNDLLVEIHLYCWKEIASRSPNEHYVWSNVDESDENKGFHYYRVAIDKISMVHGLYLTQKARQELIDLSAQIGLLSSMELALSGSAPDSEIEKSATSGYKIGIEAVERCRVALMDELGIES